jgi:hypothetical protein
MLHIIPQDKATNKRSADIFVKFLTIILFKIYLQADCHNLFLSSLPAIDTMIKRKWDI